MYRSDGCEGMGGGQELNVCIELYSLGAVVHRGAGGGMDDASASLRYYAYRINLLRKRLYSFFATRASAAGSASGAVVIQAAKITLCLVRTYRGHWAKDAPAEAA